jgi:hypothetical protein
LPAAARLLPAAVMMPLVLMLVATLQTVLRLMLVAISTMICAILESETQAKDPQSPALQPLAVPYYRRY